MTDTEINELVARKLGWTIDQTGAYKPGDDPQAYDVPDYCHDIKAAWEVVEKHICVSDEYYFCLEFNAMYWEAGWRTTDKNHAVGWSSADTAPMAICLAFLKLEK